MKKLLLVVLLATGCATMLPIRGPDWKPCAPECYRKGATCEAACYAYSGMMSKPECESECGGRGYQIIGLDQGRCVCDPTTCIRPRHKGGCEPLTPLPR